MGFHRFFLVLLQVIFLFWALLRYLLGNMFFSSRVLEGKSKFMTLFLFVFCFSMLLIMYFLLLVSLVV